eukprot:scaffold2544_cov141-Isochrysis_galbana.AAC.5
MEPIPQPLSMRYRCPRRLVGTTRYGARLHLHVHPLTTHPNSSKQSAQDRASPPFVWAEAVKEFRGLKFNRINEATLASPTPFTLE